LITRYIQYVRRVCKNLAVVSGFFCLVLVLVTVEQVLARYMFDASSVALQELQWHLFAAIFLLAAPYAYAQNRHVRVDIFLQRCPEHVQDRIEFVGILFFLLPSMLLLTYYGWEFVQQSRSFTSTVDYGVFTWLLGGEGSPNPGGLPARWILKCCIPLSSGLLILESFAKLFEIMTGERSSHA